MILGAMEAIILHSPSVESILNRRRISKELLFNYLHWKKVPVTGTLDKQMLIQKIVSFWKNNPGDVCTVFTYYPYSRSRIIACQSGSLKGQHSLQLTAMFHR